MDCREADVSSHQPEEDVKVELQKLLRVNIDVGQERESQKDSTVETSSESTDSERDCQTPSVFSIDKSMGDINNEECQTLRVSSSNKCEMDVDGEQESQSPRVPSMTASGAGILVKDEEVTFVIPKVGMEFESEDHAYKCYSRYAVLEGFSIRKDFVNKSRINGAVVSRRYTCYRQGYRPAKHNVNVRKSQQETRTGCLAHMTIARQPNGRFRVTHFETKHNHEFVTQSTTHMLPSQKRLTFAQAVEADLINSSRMDGKPKLGMGFDSEDHAYEFYNAYAGQVGFSVRKDYVNRSKIDGAVASRRFTCFREGYRQKDKRDLNVKRSRKETRIGCLAQLVISRQSDGKYRVTHFEEKHNHDLVAACRVRMLRSQKRLAVSQVAEGNVQNVFTIQPKSTFELPHNAVGDEHGYNPIDYKSKLSFKHTREMKEGEVERIQQYFRSKQLKNPSFIYVMQLDAEDQITNIFWADSKMVVDYSDFGDVVCFDTTYKVVKDGRPFSPFIGVNHHKQMVIFGGAILYDDTVESFKWLFQTFVEVMSRKRPKTILTDQDAVLAEAIAFALPGTLHRICVWHMYQKALKQLHHMFVSSDCFKNDLCSCFFDHEEEEDFIHAWKVMLDVYGLWENEWLNEIFKDREKWATAYRRHIFCADIRRAQLCECFTANLRKYLKSDSDVLLFFKQLGKMVNDWHYKELEANYDMNQQMPKLMGDVILLKHARDVYTPKIFELFQQEYEACLNIVINQCTGSGSLFEYKVSFYGQLREYTVIYNLSDETVMCSCMKFEYMGVLCSHALKVLDYRNIKILPDHYILKRWTRDARV
ncbi:protein FAR1-RELATED SEQUENCE 7-like [Pistacia vera]|uniref:protein FAR1-RELATED SEQUENCE 7-like n=1 Tax=Pistacia vera TaxID=55513 RepID=UPI001262C1D4|nr:protein FAR1-RELATED SEQUENCE 7-like [Pistacia vera]XP_031265055.1 protein FAR1-RELATED SEQUENCE 7-like [Pistacia vera]XP_031265056.1 protein FAR1-RELATED SEQUENCE 7-like [Pistacia vera]